jgi:hypothetical protein
VTAVLVALLLASIQPPAAGLRSPSELRAIDGVSVETLLPTMLAFAPRDGRVESTPRRWLSRRFRFATLLAVSRGPRATYRVSSVPRGGTAVREETLPGMTLRALQSKLEPLPSRPSGEMEFRGATALLTVRSFEKGEGGRDGFYEESFRKIAERASSSTCAGTAAGTTISGSSSPRTSCRIRSRTTAGSF